MSPIRDSEDQDITVVRRVLDGDTEAFRVLVERHQSRVLGMGMRFLRNRESAEDYSQEVFLRVYRSLPTFRGESRFYSWLMRIAYHMAIDANSSVRRVESLGEIEPVDAGRTPEEQLLYLRTREAVQHAMKELPSYHAVCIELYFFFDLKYEEISAMTGFPVNTIKSHVRRAKIRLRETLADSVTEA